MVGYLLDLNLIDADILPDHEGGNGHTNFEPATVAQSRSRDFVERVVTTFLAGFAAEARHAGQEDLEGAGWDLDVSVREWASKVAYSARDRAALVERLAARAEELVSTPANWKAIALVARTLVQHTRIDHEQALLLLRQALAVPS